MSIPEYERPFTCSNTYCASLVALVRLLLDWFINNELTYAAKSPHIATANIAEARISSDNANPRTDFLFFIALFYTV